MFAVPLKELKEHHLEAFRRDGVGESDKTEFKRELALSSPSERAEAAKDVSAMANGVGGRIYYGIAEKKLDDGTVVASEIVPLADGSLPERLENVLVEGIHPVPRYEMYRVDVDSGYVLVVEVYPSYSRDLHMVSGFKQYRFYRRGEYRTIPMSEPEIREAYLRIAASRYAIEEDMQRTIQQRRKKAAGAPESAFVVPLYGRPNLIDPRQFGDTLGADLCRSNVCIGNLHTRVKNLRVVSGGYEWVGSSDETNTELVGIYRNGVIHCATARSAGTKGSQFSLIEMVDYLASTILTAKYVFDRAKYWGPVRICHILHMADRFFVASEPRLVTDPYDWLERQPGEYRQEVYEVTLDNRSELHAAAVELADQLFQMAGAPVCPWFDASRRVIAADLPSSFKELLS